MVSGNVIEPKIMGSAVNLHPVTVLMALIFWGMLWGFVGMYVYETGREMMELGVVTPEHKVTPKMLNIV